MIKKICDFCGNEKGIFDNVFKTKIGNLILQNDISWNLTSPFVNHSFEIIDICESCKEKLSKLIDDFILLNKKEE